MLPMPRSQSVRVQARCVPISIKDLFAVTSFPTYAGSQKRLPPKFEIEGPLIAKLRRQLPVIMGKTHMVEFTFGATGQNTHYGNLLILGMARRVAHPAVLRAAQACRFVQGSALLAFGSDTASTLFIEKRDSDLSCSSLCGRRRVAHEQVVAPR
jgi:aspartyl-tRNA(Asn)/glutamyl-tRNA(Gln) amidotransferase subunit A